MSNWRAPKSDQQRAAERTPLYFFAVFGFVMACFGFLGIYLVLTGTTIWSRKAPVAAVALALVGVVMFGASLSQILKSRRQH